MSVYRVGSNKSSVNNFPSIRPTLDLDFANSKTLDPRINFTRASGGSYVGADGLIKYAGINEARFDHDPVTGESLGLLIEETRFNAYNYSEQLVSPYYNLLNVSTISNFDTSPDGKQTATKIVENTQNIPHYIAKSSGTVDAGTPCTASCFVKATSSNRFFSIIFESLSLFGGVTYPRAGFDLNNGTIVSGSVTTGLATAKIENYGNGWYRCSLATTPLVTGNISVQFRPQAPSTSVSLLGPYQGDGISGLLLWGLQFDLGSFASSYIPTQGSTRTRAADGVEITGKNFSDFFNKNEGTSLITYRPRFDGNYQSPFAHLFAFSDNITSARTIGFAGNANSTQLYFIGSSSSLSTTILPGFTWLSPPTPSSKRTERIVVSYGADYIRMYENSNSFFSTNPTYGRGKIEDIFKTQVNPPSVNYVRFYIGDKNFGSSRFNCTVQNFRYYPKDLGPQTLKNISQIYP